MILKNKAKLGSLEVVEYVFHSNFIELYLTMLGWLRERRMAISLSAEPGTPLCFFPSFIFLTATFLSICLSWAATTIPKAPSPSFSKNWSLFPRAPSSSRGELMKPYCCRASVESGSCINRLRRVSQLSQNFLLSPDIQSLGRGIRHRGEKSEEEEGEGAYKDIYEIC